MKKREKVNSQKKKDKKKNGREKEKSKDGASFTKWDSLKGDSMIQKIEQMCSFLKKFSRQWLFDSR